MRWKSMNGLSKTFLLFLLKVYSGVSSYNCQTMLTLLWVSLISCPAMGKSYQTKHTAFLMASKNFSNISRTLL
ncbi:hypothetical protein XENTR_v10000334 [Xenopus tropicalis]|nr:hypothetical protein XENTR_v10000334 [Xenopus tropicalis]